MMQHTAAGQGSSQLGSAQTPTTKPAHVIVIGNEKGGSGKTTTTMHLITALLRLGFSVGSMDIDSRQRSLSRYIENRRQTIAKEGTSLPLPHHVIIQKSPFNLVDEAEADERERFVKGLGRILHTNDFVVIDSPGSDTFLSRLAHSFADTIITPINDSFVDLDVLANVDGQTLKVIRPSIYSEMVWEQKLQRAKRDGGSIEWIVMRNRLSNIDARNKRFMTQVLTELARRIGFRVAPGFSERVIFREMFLQGLTVLDVIDTSSNVSVSLSHLAARQEVRELLKILRIPAIDERVAEVRTGVAGEEQDAPAVKAKTAETETAITPPVPAFLTEEKTSTEAIVSSVSETKPAPAAPFTAAPITPAAPVAATIIPAVKPAAPTIPAAATVPAAPALAAATPTAPTPAQPVASLFAPAAAASIAKPAVPAAPATASASPVTAATPAQPASNPFTPSAPVEAKPAAAVAAPVTATPFINPVSPAIPSAASAPKPAVTPAAASATPASPAAAPTKPASIMSELAAVFSPAAKAQHPAQASAPSVPVTAAPFASAATPKPVASTFGISALSASPSAPKPFAATASAVPTASFAAMAPKPASIPMPGASAPVATNGAAPATPMTAKPVSSPFAPASASAPTASAATVSSPLASGGADSFVFPAKTYSPFAPQKPVAYPAAETAASGLTAVQNQEPKAKVAEGA